MLPHFFVYAKNKKEEQVEPANHSVVNMLDYLIKDKRLRFAIKDFGKLDYCYLMKNKDIEVDDNVIFEYLKLSRKYHYKINNLDSHSNFGYLNQEIRNRLNQFGYSEEDISDMLVKYLYGLHNSSCKGCLWFCYGEYIYNNLKKNLSGKTKICQKCGCRFVPTTSTQKYCEEHKNFEHKIWVRCGDCDKEFLAYKNATKTYRCKKCQKIYNNKMNNKEYVPKGYKKITCSDCGKAFYISIKDNQTKRCKECQHKYRNEYNAMKQREYYKKKKSV
ncbi:MAG: hypothetical protein PHN69_07895 [Candidatus Pacebacteria bacterium]|nr:hypothetical protein [Candidatus Paceibacterota bacterium]